MGWNTVSFDKESSLTRGLDREARFYFVHSYYVKPKDKEKSILSTSYSFNFVSAIQEENIFGVQFHPEKSHSFGMKIFKNFSDF